MSSRLRSPVLVARADEVALVDRLLGEAGQGRGAVVAVQGEPGVGKSRLLADAVERARAAGVPALVGRAAEGSGSFRPLADALLAHQRTHALPPPSAVGPFAAALGRLVPGWSPEPGGEAHPEAHGDLPLLVSEALLRVLRLIGGERGVVLVLDDLHWADADTLTVLDRLAEAVDDVPVLLLLAAREQQRPAWERIRSTPSVHALTLRRLSDEQVGALTASCAGGLPLPRQVQRHVVEHAEGLPFLVEELLRGLVDSGALVRTAGGWESSDRLHTPVPASFAALVHQRLARLSPTMRDVVEAAAVLGRTVDWRLLVALTGQPEPAVIEALRAAVDRGLLTHGERDDRGVVRFVHALTREAVLETLLPPVRARLAADAAGPVEQAGQRVLAAELHAEAGDPQRASRLLLEAAQAEGGALGTREELLRRAAQLAPDDPDITHALVEVLALAGRAVEARELGGPLLARTPADDARRSGLALTLARSCLITLQADQAGRYLAEAGQGAAAQALASSVALLRGRPDEAEALAASAAEADDPRVQCEALELLGRLARQHDRPDDAEAAFARALQVAESHGLSLQRVRALAELGTLDMLRPARHDRLEQARALALQTGQLETAAMLDRQVAACHNLRMEHDESLTAASRGIEIAESLRLPVLSGGCMLFVASALGHTGQVDAMHATLDEAEQRVQDDQGALPGVIYARAIPAVMEHDLDALRSALEAGSACVRALDSPAPTPWRGMHMLLEVVADGDRPGRDELRRSGATVQASNRAALAYADAVVAARRGDDPAADLALAEELMQPLTWRRNHLRLLVAPAAIRDGWGLPVEWLREALTCFEQRGEAGLARACREELRRAGAPVPRRNADAGVPADLRRLGITPREAEVLALVAEGLTSAAIAQRLYLSPRTVETHVARLLAKTGVSSRAELRTYVVSRS